MDDLKLEEQFISTNGIKLHTVLAGPQSGVPVILLHGFPETWRCWIRQLTALVHAGCRVIVPDQRGYNLSDKPKGIKNYRIDELAKDILGLIDALDYEKVNLVGHDFGALVAWAIGISKSSRIHRLGIINVPHPAVLQRFIQRDLEQLRRSWYAIMFQLPWLPEAGMRAGNWRGAERALRGSGKVHTFTNEDITEYKKAWSQPYAITAMINWHRAAFWYPFRILHGNNGRVKIPTLMLWGMKDIALTHRMARPSMEYCDDGQLVFFPDSTHWVQREEVHDVNAHLLEFIVS